MTNIKEKNEYKIVFEIKIKEDEELKKKLKKFYLDEIKDKKDRQNKDVHVYLKENNEWVDFTESQFIDEMIGEILEEEGD